jgi:hypothetical protein
MLRLSATLTVWLILGSGAAVAQGTVGASPGTSAPTAASPAPQPGQPGASTPAPTGRATSRPGAAQSANSDGYAECMAMWNSNTSGMSRADWSATCNRTRFVPK